MGNPDQRAAQGSTSTIEEQLRRLELAPAEASGRRRVAGRGHQAIQLQHREQMPFVIGVFQARNWSDCIVPTLLGNF